MIQRVMLRCQVGKTSKATQFTAMNGEVMNCMHGLYITIVHAPEATLDMS
jgi:hypothetical protein